MSINMIREFECLFVEQMILGIRSSTRFENVSHDAFDDNITYIRINKVRFAPKI